MVVPEHNQIINIISIISGGVTGVVTCLLDLYSLNIANIIRAITIVIVNGYIN